MPNWNRFVKGTLKRQQDKPDKGREKIASADNVDIKKRSENSDKEQFSKC